VDASTYSLYCFGQVLLIATGLRVLGSCVVSRFTDPTGFTAFSGFDVYSYFTDLTGLLIVKHHGAQLT
jgi:hypothetical protein